MNSSESLPFALDTSSEIPKFRAETFWTKEPETIEWINRQLQTDTMIGLFIDVGANIGIYSLYASSVSSKVKIIAVEPVGQNFMELEKNILRNNKQDQITSFQMALSKISGKGILLNVDERLGSSGAQIQISENGKSATTVVMTGDDLLQKMNGIKLQNGLGVMLKVDTDGNELDVLRGFEVSFNNGQIHSVLIETHPSNRNGIEEFLLSKKLAEDKSYLEIEGHSDHRREAKGNLERTKIYSI